MFMNVIENIVNRVLEDYGMKAELIGVGVNGVYVSWVFKDSLGNDFVISYNDLTDTIYVNYIERIAKLIIKEMRKHIMFWRKRE